METDLAAVAPVSSLKGLHDRGHVAVFGKTGSGKSVFLKKNAADTHLVSFFINPHREPLKAELVKSPSGLANGLSEGRTRFQWHPPRLTGAKGREEIQRQLQGYVDVLYRVGRTLMGGKDKAEPWILVVIDEVHLFTEKVGVMGPVESLLTEGRKYGIRVWVANQRPARVSLEVLGQSWVVVFFRLDPPDVKYLRAQGYPVDEWFNHTEKAHHFILLNGEKWHRFRPIDA